MRVFRTVALCFLLTVFKEASNKVWDNKHYLSLPMAHLPTGPRPKSGSKRPGQELERPLAAHAGSTSQQQPAPMQVEPVPLKYVVQEAVKRWFDDTLQEAQRGEGQSTHALDHGDPHATKRAFCARGCFTLTCVWLPQVAQGVFPVQTARSMLCSDAL